MMMYSSYSGVLVSNIMVRRTDVAVNSFQEAMDTDHKVAFLSSFFFIFRKFRYSLNFFQSILIKSAREGVGPS